MSLRNAVPSLIAAFCFLVVLCGNSLAADEGPRVFVTDSSSWETRSSGGGGGGIFAQHGSGGARPQTAEIIKTFGEKCTQVMINNRQDKANYVVVLDHEGGKGLLSHKNKIAVFSSASGDSVFSHSTLSLGGSVEGACAAILKDWADHVAAPAASTPAASASAAAAAPMAAALTTPALAAQTTKVSIGSTPDGADIEIDGSFVGNTPSTAELTPGDHTISVAKSGYKAWTRKMKTGGGDVRISAELEKN